MGIFATRPEEPFEWAGLPSEPERLETDAEHLEVRDADAFGLTAGTVESIVIPVVPSVEIVQTQESADGGEDD